ncbi:MAG: hypothetical protein K8F25_06830 [Fimbriimonadaceae bacterium]|nr:hypothetical protein [Alphaproteobacteria bacterium]
MMPPPIQWVICAQSISEVMKNEHGCAPLNHQQIEQLSAQLYKLDIRRSLQKPEEKVPSNKRILKQLGLFESALLKLKEFQKATDEEDKKNFDAPTFHAWRVIRRHEMTDEFGTDVSIAEWLKQASDIYEIARKERKKITSDGYIEEWTENPSQPRTGRAYKTELMGNYLPALYAEIYPEGSMGGRQGGDTLTGPGYTFISEAMENLGYSDINNEQISASRRNTHLRGGKR